MAQVQPFDGAAKSEEDLLAPAVSDGEVPLILLTMLCDPFQKKKKSRNGSVNSLRRNRFDFSEKLG